MHSSRIRALLASLLIATVAGACGSAASPQSGGGQDTTVSVALSDFKFLPATLALPAGKKVTLRVTNTGSIEHTLTVPALGIDVTVRPDGKAHDVTVGPLSKTGTFDMVCTVAGHKEAGMVGKATVK